EQLDVVAVPQGEAAVERVPEGGPLEHETRDSLHGLEWRANALAIPAPSQLFPRPRRAENREELPVRLRVVPLEGVEEQRCQPAAARLVPEALLEVGDTGVVGDPRPARIVAVEQARPEELCLLCRRKQRRKGGLERRMQRARGRERRAHFDFLSRRLSRQALRLSRNAVRDASAEVRVVLAAWKRR